MKNIMMVVSVLFTIGFVIVILGLMGVSGDISAISESILVIFGLNIIPILTIAVCCFALERNDQNYLLRILPIYMLIPIILTSVVVLFQLDIETAGTINKVINFILSTASPLFVLSILFITKSNNSISKIFRTLAFAAIAVTFLCTAFTQITKFFEDKLPNIYEYDGYGGFNFTESTEALQFQQQVAIYSTVTEIFSVLMLFITNYAFSSKVDYDADDIDYDKIKETANNISSNQMENRYNVNNLNKTTPSVTQTTNNNKGLMNIDNQLGVDSKVGKVSEAAAETMIENSSIDSIIPLSNGPVINNTIKNDDVIETPVQEIKPHNESTPVVNQQEAVVQNNTIPTPNPNLVNNINVTPQQNVNTLQGSGPVSNNQFNNQNVSNVSVPVSNNTVLPTANMVQGNVAVSNNQVASQSAGPVLNNMQGANNTTQQTTTSQNKFI